MLVADITVRVFFYGLIAFVPAKDKSVTVVVQDEGDHVPFVWYQGKCTSVIGGSCDNTFDFYGQSQRGSVSRMAQRSTSPA